ncbi:hypothetical protein RCZ15_15170 [Capnocytophaga catalasegens]|uniref:Bacteriocin n=2 Tax=Capnocytophaga catalasegens TaxID=1004260 RepID=A0AAV5AVI3_9FLAO|nr:hypothetical protein RCZ03_23120 [Capnocytophaga catalasegens]GJM50544.1 hypothetical protein RCZ15_15170 [Capnocytophaga catalasegens]GJM53223.1 hypothetical protein RCZ16_15400 [Capnocytophaga catalasegens]
MNYLNKKAILGMLVTMIMSLGIMGGVNKTNKIDSNLQQVAVGCGYMASQSEGGGATGAWMAASGVATGFAVNVAYGAAVNTWNPAGWVGWGVAGISAL